MSLGLAWNNSVGWAAVFDAAGFQAVPELDANAFSLDAKGTDVNVEEIELAVHAEHHELHGHRSLAAAFGHPPLELELAEIDADVNLGGGSVTANSGDGSAFGTIFGPIIDRTMETLGQELNDHLGPKIDRAIDAVMDMAFGEDDDGGSSEEGGDGDGETGGGDDGGGDAGGGDGGDGGASTERSRQASGPRHLGILDAADHLDALDAPPSDELGDTATHEVASGHARGLTLDDDDDDVVAPRRRRLERIATEHADADGAAVPTRLSAAADVDLDTSELDAFNLPEVGDEVLVSMVDDDPDLDDLEPEADDTDPLDDLP